MARSGAQRQAEYRARVSRSARAMHLWLADCDKLALKRLARHRGQSQAEVVAELLRAAEEQVTAGMDDTQIDAYYGGRH